MRRPAMCCADYPGAVVLTAPSTKHLKLAGGDRLKGKRSIVPWPAWTNVHYSYADGGVARSLSAIR